MTILQRVEKFLQDHVKNLETLTTTKLEELKQDFTACYTNDSSTFMDKTLYLWEQIHTGLEQFNHTEQLYQAVRPITTKELVQFYKHYVIDYSTATKVVVIVHGKGNRPSDDELKAFQHTMTF